MFWCVLNFFGVLAVLGKKIIEIRPLDAENGLKQDFIQTCVVQCCTVLCCGAVVCRAVLG